MHRDACLTGQPISLRHEGRCRSDASGRQLKKVPPSPTLVAFPRLAFAGRVRLGPVFFKASRVGTLNLASTDTGP